MINLFRVFLALSLVFAANSCTQKDPGLSDKSKQNNPKQIPHLEKQGTANRLVVDGKPYLMIAGELHNSTAGGFDSMRPVWKKLAAKNLNSVIATVSWELIEPVQGKFDFSLVDSTIAGARSANLKLVLIWFGSWKNASSVYIPSWVKNDFEKFLRVRDEQGIPLEIVSTFGNATMESDATAFAALMHHIKEVDSEQQTVVMMQVENEVGILDHMGKTPGNARRDFSDPANAAFNSGVPKELMDYLVQNKDNLFPELSKVWTENGNKTSGSWEEIFGKSSFKPDPKNWKFYSFYTEELFMAWNYAKYIGRVAEAGKKEYPLPMYVNAWLKQPFSYWPGRYPSGGPLPQVLDVWRAAAPSIDFIAPDIYTDEFVWTCREFTRSNNPLFIPEIQGGKHSGPRAFYVFGEFDAGCFSPFAIDDERYAENDPFTETYGILQKMSPIILENQGKGSMKGILVDSLSPVQTIGIGDFIIQAKLNGGGKTSVAGGLIIQTDKMEFICAGSSLDILFSIKNDSMRMAVDAVDEGTFTDGKWVPLRRLNGDEVAASTWSGTGVLLPANKVSIQKISLYRYK
jgi:beta-galactosidase GanA